MSEAENRRRLAAVRDKWDKVGVHPDQPPADPKDEPESEPESDNPTDVTQEQIEQDIRSVLHYAMHFGGGTEHERKVKAAVAAIKYLAVRARLPLEVGEGLDGVDD